MVKLTSLISVISLTELLTVGQRLYAQNFLVMETLGAVAVYYVLIVSLFGWLLQRLEQHLDLGQRTPQTLDEASVARLRAAQQPLAQPARVQSVAGAAPALYLQNIHKRYGDHEVLKALTWRSAAAR